jgi:hypothetical protein
MEPLTTNDRTGVGGESRQARLAATAVAFRGRSRRTRLTWYQIYWPDLVILFVIAVSVWAIRRDLLYQPTPAQTVRVAIATGLNPFHVIVRSDLKTNTSPPDPDSLKFIDHAIGRYSTQFVAANAELKPGNLNAGPTLSTELADRIIIRVRVASTTVFTGIPTPFSAGLMAAPRERGAGPLLLQDVLVLDLQKDGDAMSAVLAIPSKDQPSLISFASRSDFYLVATKL